MKNLFLIFIILLILNFDTSYANNNRLIIASTTSTSDTGLLNYLNKEFNKENDIKINVLSLGTGQALEVAKDGNADIVLVHHKPSELEFINKGYGLYRYDLMYNDYLIVGPKNSNIDCRSIKQTLIQIKNNNLLFLSRSDESGTHKKEKELWNDIELNYKLFDNWYKKIGQGMGITLMMANEMLAFTLADRSSWIAFNNKQNLKIICENVPPLHNQYGIIAVNPNITKKNNKDLVDKYINWIISEKGKKLIENYKKKGHQLFFFNYDKKKDPAS